MHRTSSIEYDLDTSGGLMDVSSLSIVFARKLRLENGGRVILRIIKQIAF